MLTMSNVTKHLEETGSLEGAVVPFNERHYVA